VALVVPDAHYMSIAWSGETRLERRYADPNGWGLLERACAEQFSTSPLEPTHVIVRMLIPAGRRDAVTVWYIGDGHIDAGLGKHMDRIDEWLLEYFWFDHPKDSC
jgi:hypothetical protein